MARSSLVWPDDDRKDAGATVLFSLAASDEGGCRRQWFSAGLGGSLERSPAMGSSASLFFLAAAAFYFSLLLSNSQQRAPLPVDLKKRTPIPPIQFID